MTVDSSFAQPVLGGGKSYFFSPLASMLAISRRFIDIGTRNFPKIVQKKFPNFNYFT
jgi:hypothetical protein